MAVASLNARYAQALDDKDFLAWPRLFTSDGRYRIVSAENTRRGLTLPLLDYSHPAMMRDRMMALKEAAVFTQAWERRLITNIVVSPADNGLRASANVAIYRTDNIEGTTALFVTARYDDEIEVNGSEVLFRSRTVHLDTFSVPNHIGFPL